MRRLLNRSLVLSLLFAGIGGAVIYTALSGNGGLPAAGNTEEVLVAARTVAVGSRLSADDVRVEEVPEGSVPAGVLRSLDDVKNRYAAYMLVEGELLLRAKVSESPPGSALAALIPAGRVAVSVAVSDVISTGGFIAPGDRVDVLGVVTKDAGDDAEIVLNDIPVLAVSSNVVGGEQRTERSGQTNGTTSNPRSLDTTVTLAVTVEEARRLVQVDEVGQLRLALRPRSDVDELLRRQ